MAADRLRTRPQKEDLVEMNVVKLLSVTATSCALHARACDAYSVHVCCGCYILQNPEADTAIPHTAKLLDTAIVSSFEDEA